MTHFEGIKSEILHFDWMKNGCARKMKRSFDGELPVTFFLLISDMVGVGIAIASTRIIFTLNLKWSNRHLRRWLLISVSILSTLTLQTARSSKMISWIRLLKRNETMIKDSAQTMAPSFASKRHDKKRHHCRCRCLFVVWIRRIRRSSPALVFFILHLQQKGNESDGSNTTNSITWRGIVNGNDI